MSTIKWLPTTAMGMNDNPTPGTIIVGSPGSGKTFFLINIAANCLGMGQRVIAIDPKNDLGAICNISKNIEVIDINNIRAGALNPITFLKRELPDGTFAPIDTTTLLSVITLLTGKLDQNDIIDVTPIIEDFVNSVRRNNEYHDMTDVANYLYKNKSLACQKVGTLLRKYQDSKYGPLLFTDETNIEPLIISKEKSLLITMHGMELPDYNKKAEDYTDNERFTSAIIYIITRKLLDILNQENEIPVAFICDEAHLLFGNKEMAQIIDRFLVLGRSLNVATVLASQGISHFPAGIANYLSSKFMFKSSMDEASAFLDLFNSSLTTPVDVNSLLPAVTNFPQGVCFFIDRKNRNGIIKITSNYDIDLITSNPLQKKKRKKKLEEQSILDEYDEEEEEN